MTGRPTILRSGESVGRKARARREKEKLWRTACDDVAGGTDRYALEEYARFGWG